MRLVLVPELVLVLAVGRDQPTRTTVMMGMKAVVLPNLRMRLRGTQSLPLGHTAILKGKVLLAGIARQLHHRRSSRLGWARRHTTILTTVARKRTVGPCLEVCRDRELDRGQVQASQGVHRLELGQVRRGREPLVCSA